VIADLAMVALVVYLIVQDYRTTRAEAERRAQAPPPRRRAGFVPPREHDDRTR
jgi:hypothetical protein